ncbi:hypothetical protein Aph02nite_53880 [Actinoplanes philippinensis]|uniref:Uncharacterized protein n=1 Tax=Actinoplanes philippinensis TaxID=35752 RepID=A0A1I2JBJ8_9ACTN|nr:hypothetical protein [Actinoplanes philippinensis]GIE79438.1 hypothetical protein Aph02nite_53880 [Actinoplanes philippinensis]SFF50246.1 hypothetical protein SAMN05421541_111414 [Actinoplanes philippinensis]
MTTEQHPQQNEPNEFGFAGAATGPEATRQTSTEGDAEDIAVPADDLTGPLTHALEEATSHDES